MNGEGGKADKSIFSQKNAILETNVWKKHLQTTSYHYQSCTFILLINENLIKKISIMKDHNLYMNTI